MYTQTEKAITLDKVLIVREYPDVFPDDLTSLPLARDVEFNIDILPGTTPIYKAPYIMVPTELKELKVQLDKLLGKKFI